MEGVWTDEQTVLAAASFKPAIDNSRASCNVRWSSTRSLCEFCCCDLSNETRLLKSRCVDPLESVGKVLMFEDIGEGIIVVDIEAGIASTGIIFKEQASATGDVIGSCDWTAMDGVTAISVDDSAYNLLYVEVPEKYAI